MTGNAVDASASVGIEGVSITLTYLDTPASGEESPGPFLSTTGTDGTYTIADVGNGSYEISASRTGYTFAQQTVTLSGQTLTLSSDRLNQYLSDLNVG